MIRFAILGCVMVSGAVFAENKIDVPKELTPFQGSWTVVEVVVDGTPLKPEHMPKSITFEGPKLSVKSMGMVENLTFTVDEKQNPAAIDLSNKSFGIYKFDKDGKMILFVKDKGPTRPKTFEADTGVRMVLERVKK